MFNDEFNEALNTFDDVTSCEFINPEDLVEEAKEKNQGLYKDLKSFYDLFKYHLNQDEIFSGSEYLNNIKSNVVTLYKKYKIYTPIINSFMGFLCFYDDDYKNAQTYFLKDNNFLDAFYVCIKQYEKTNSEEDRTNAFNIGKKELEIECHEKDITYIDFYIFRFIMQYCIDIEDFSTIISLIDIMYSNPFKKNRKFEDFYFCLIKLSSVKSINLRFLQNKEFFSKENFQTVCIQIKDVLSATDTIQSNVVISFDDLIAKGTELKTQKDFQSAENSYREAINISTTAKQRQSAFKEIYNLYKHTDQVKMLSIINEFFDMDVFENDFIKYYEKSQMLIYTNAQHCDISDNLNFLAQSINSFDRKPWRWNEPITLCMELIKIYVQNLVQLQMFDEAHSMCKLGLSLNSEIKRSDAVIDSYLKFFSNTQTKCGKVKKDLAKKGTAKIVQPTAVKMESKKSSQEEISNDPENMPIFKFNPSGLLQYIEISTLEDYEQYCSDYNSTTKKLNQETISKKISKLISNVQVSRYIKSIYILDDVFVGTPQQARKDIDFYLNSKIRTSFDKKRDEYLSLARIVSDIINNYGECEEFNITENIRKEYIMYAMLYHSKCVSSEESKRYYLNIAKLIHAQLMNENDKNIDENINEIEKVYYESE